MPHPETKPTWRGLLHEVAVVPVAVLVTVFVVRTDATLGRVALGVHGAGLVLLLITSAVYHRHCNSEATRRLARRADHGAIFVLIAASYVPISLFAVPRWLGIPVLAAVWLVALRGVSLKLRHLELGQDRFHSWMYGALGWAGALLAPWMVIEMGWARFSLVVIGGIVFSLGGLALINKRPDPWPDTFGYHEIWHLAVLIGAITHLVMSALVV